MLRSALTRNPGQNTDWISGGLKTVSFSRPKPLKNRRNKSGRPDFIYPQADLKLTRIASTDPTANSRHSNCESTGTHQKSDAGGKGRGRPQSTSAAGAVRAPYITRRGGRGPRALRSVGSVGGASQALDEDRDIGYAGGNR